MGRMKLRVHQTNPEVLVSNLRGEIGEIITSWTLLRMFMAEAARERSEDVAANLRNQRLISLDILLDKLTDEIVARLSELAEQKVGRLNFYFATEKIGAFKQEAIEFSKFIRRHRFKAKRDSDISHKEAPQSWDDHKYLHIPHGIVLKGVAHAMHLMKKIDRMVLGPCAPYLWRKVRERRYKPMAPPRAAYLLLPHYFLTPIEREEIIVQEIKEGRAKWEKMPTKIDGADATILAYRKWAAVIVHRRLIVLEVYPLNELTSLNTNVPTEEAESVKPEGAPNPVTPADA